MIKRKEVKTYKEALFCPNCDMIMVYESILPTRPPLHKHYCPQCKEESIEREKYPRIVHEPIGAEEVMR